MFTTIKHGWSLSPPLSLKTEIIGQATSIGLVAGSLNAVLHAYAAQTSIWELLPVYGVMSMLMGICIGLLEAFMVSRNRRRKTFLHLLVIRLLAYSLIVQICLVLVWTQYPTDDSLAAYWMGQSFTMDFAFAMLFILGVVSVLEVNRLHGKGELLRFILGRYHDPKETERIFLFVDLKSSTAIAEQLGNLTYSRFLKDFFADLTEAILLTRGEVYQYVGDEIVITWPMAKGLYQWRCVRCFFQMKESIAARQEAYRREYGVIPEFKAGLHGGRVVVTWIGEIKKEIVYHGDVINTTARLRSLCNELSQDLLLSGDLLEKPGQLLPHCLKTTSLGALTLRGKKQIVQLFGVHIATPTVHAPLASSL